MACSCGKSSTPPRGSQSAQAAQAAADRAKAVAEARAANPSTHRIGPAAASGQAQTFTLQVGGRTQTFGSALERDAAAARL